jgi:hypothetical protein
VLFVDDGQRADRIPSGVELQKEFDAITVTEGELMSEVHGDRQKRQRGQRETAREENRIRVVDVPPREMKRASYRDKYVLNCESQVLPFARNRCWLFFT